VKQRLEDWEMHSVKSISTITKRVLLSVTPQDLEDSRKDVGIQTIKRMNEVKTTNVDILFETSLKKPPMAKIPEREEYDSDDLNQILKKADEVLQQ